MTWAFVGFVVAMLYLSHTGSAVAARWAVRRAPRSIVTGASTLAGASVAAAHWAFERTPKPTEPGGSALLGISCRSRTWCMAVGGPETKRGHMIAELWNGRAWSLLPIPRPPGASATVLDDVRCPSRTECVAVGAMIRGGRMSGLVERWDEGTWDVERTSTRRGYATTTLYGVSCLSASSCVAVGEWDNRAGYQFPLLERWNGSAWSIRPTAGRGSGYSYLYGVSCTSSSACTAVGVADGQAMAERWNGTRWLVEPGANPDDYSGSGLGAVSCVTSTFCAAAGGGSNADSDEVPDNSVQEIWNGTKWSVKEDVDPNNNINYDLYGVSCASTTACLAVGDVAERWNGTTWSPEPIPTREAMNAVSCPSRSGCVVVGAQPDQRGRDVPLVLRWSS